MHKKGQIGQVVILMITLLAIGLTIMVGRLILTEFYTTLDENDLNSPAMETAQAGVESAFGSFDYAMVILTIVLMIGLIITSFLIPTHPLFMVINIIGIFVLVFIGMILTNVYGETVAGDAGVSSGLSIVADDFGKTNYLLSRLPFIGAIAIFISSVVMYAKGRGGGSY